MSLPVGKSTTSPMFAVTGKSLQLQSPRALPPLPTRKIYNPSYFFNETYQHEIANHYRDYKRRARIPRRRRHTIYVPYRRAAFYGVVSGEPRAVLPIAVHDFPRFTAVYTTPRGRQTLCENAPPDDTYNATVRRIRQADSNKELKLLVDRQLRWRCVTNYCNGRVDARQRQHTSDDGAGFCGRKVFKYTPTGAGKDEKSSKRQINSGADVNADAATNANGKLYDYIDEYVVDDADDSVANDSVEKVKASALQLSSSKQIKNKQNLYKNQLAPKQTTHTASTASVARNQHSATALTKVSTYAQKARAHTVNYNKSKQPFSAPTEAALSSTASYLRLACEYYEQGVLRQLDYLQAIGRRNAARREQRRLATALPTARSSSNEESASRDSSASNTPLSTPRVRSAAHCFRLTHLLRRIGRKRSFKVGCSDNAPPAEHLQHNPCAIRVNIKPFVGRGAVQALKATRKQDDLAPSAATAHTARTLDGCSMNDYLNANSSNAITTTTVAARAHFHELIDHLMQLEISDIDASLPKITLTDCSTIANTAPVATEHTVCNSVQTATSHSNDSAFAFQFDNAYNSNSFSAYNAFDSQVAVQKQQQQQQLEQQLQTSARRNGFTLRQTKFGTSYSSLDIPDAIYYNSEARPP